MINAIEEHEIEEYCGHKFEVVEYRDDDYPAQKIYGYKIYDDYFKDLLFAGSNQFDSEAEARFAAIGHITLIENGED